MSAESGGRASRHQNPIVQVQDHVRVTLAVGSPVGEPGARQVLDRDGPQAKCAEIGPARKFGPFQHLRPGEQRVAGEGRRLWAPPFRAAIRQALPRPLKLKARARLMMWPP